jgi:hypothetical protein
LGLLALPKPTLVRFLLPAFLNITLAAEFEPPLALAMTGPPLWDLT